MSKVVDTSASFKDRYIEIESAATHAHGPVGEHTHGGVAFTTWLDHSLAVRQAEAIRNGLTKMLPDRAKELSHNFEALKSDIDSLDAHLAELIKEHGATLLLASHPVYQYFARRYRLRIKSLHWESSEVPDDRQWAELDKLLEEHPAKWMIWETMPNPETEEKLRERRVRCVVFSPCGNVPRDGDYLQIMQRNIEMFKLVFRSQLE